MGSEMCIRDRDGMQLHTEGITPTAGAAAPVLKWNAAGVSPGAVAERAAGMKTPRACIMAGKPHGARYTGGLDSRFRGNDGFRTVVRLKCDCAKLPTHG